MSRRITWPAGRPLTRAHSHEFGSTEFDGRDHTDARFSPLWPANDLLPVLYGGQDDRTAAAETVFRRLPTGGRLRRIWLDRYRAWHWSQISATRDLTLLAVDASLAGAGRLVDGDAGSYEQSRRLAGQLLERHEEVDGLAWVSRQLHDRPSSLTIDVDSPDVCLLLVAASAARTGGVQRNQLTANRPVTPFASTQGLERLDVIAHELDVSVIRA